MQNRRRSWTLRSRLALLVIVAVAPGFFIAALQTLQQFRQARSNTSDALRLDANIVLGRHKRVLFAAAGLMHAATERAGALPPDARCERLRLTSVDNRVQGVAFEAIADAESRVLCSVAVGRDGRLNDAERTAVDKAAATGVFSEGAYELAPAGGGVEMPVAYPMPAHGDRPLFLVGSILVDPLDQLAMDLPLPAGSVLTILDSEGRVLARSPNPEYWVGAGVKESQLFAMISNPGSDGIGETIGLDGIPRLYAFVPMKTGALPETLIIGIPSSIAFRDAQQTLLTALVGLIASAGVGIVGSRIVARRAVRQRSVALAAMARRLAAGELSARTHSPGGADEMDQLASVFNDMAARLQAADESEKQRYAELLEHDAALRAAAESLELQRQRLDALSRELLRAQEKERQHIARELHDHLGQDLTALKLNLQEERGDGPSISVDESVRIVDRMLGGLRSLAHSLRPPLLQEMGLRGAVTSLLKSESLRCGIGAHLDTTVGDTRFSPEIELVVFRIVQEAMTNALRHSQAANVSVALHHVDGGLELSVTDDGRGFDVQKVGEAGSGFGMLSMQERAMLVGGQLHIESAPGSGTSIRARIPTA